MKKNNENISGSGLDPNIRTDPEPENVTKRQKISEDHEMVRNGPTGLKLISRVLSTQICSLLGLMLVFC